MNQKNILMIAPYADMYLMALQIIEKYNYPIHVIQGSMETLESACEAIKEYRPSVVISRGGTYLLLKKRFPDLILVEVKISSYDILRACMKIKDSDNVIAFLGFSNIILGGNLIGPLLKKKFFSVTLSDREKPEIVAAHIEELSQKGVTYFVCDNICYHVAKDLGYSAHLVRSEEESLMQYMEEAIRLLNVKINEQLNAKRYQSIVNSVDDGILFLDNYSKKPLFNNSALHFIDKHHLTVKGFLDLLEPCLNTSNMEAEVIRLPDGGSITIQKLPIELGGETAGITIKFQSTSHIQKLEEKIRTQLSQKGLTAKYRFSDILYKSPAMEKTVNIAKKFAASESTVLIEAATGTGKELFAQSIHNASPRSAHPFVAINCAALPENLLESELFGYAEGAFTGAKKGGKMGLIELAHTGTLFLDEIGDMPVSLQTRLLRVIQEREVMRVGDTKIHPVDIRIIAATNMDLASMVKEGRFRQDLFYRLNILTLHIPSLNERLEDISVLADKFLKESSAACRKTFKGFDKASFSALLNHHYSGNVRELQGIIERACVLAEGEYITQPDLSLPVSSPKFSSSSLEEMEQELLRSALEECGQNYTKAARQLGISRSTLYRKLKQ